MAVFTMVVFVALTWEKKRDGARSEQTKNRKVYEKKSNVGKCRFFGHFGTLYALASWEVEKAFNKKITKKIGDTKSLSDKHFSKKKEKNVV